MTELRDPYFFLLGKHLEDPLPEPTPEPTFAEEHTRLSAEIAAVQARRMGKVA